MLHLLHWLIVCDGIQDLKSTCFPGSASHQSRHRCSLIRLHIIEHLQLSVVDLYNAKDDAQVFLKFNPECAKKKPFTRVPIALACTVPQLGFTPSFSVLQ